MSVKKEIWADMALTFVLARVLVAEVEDPSIFFFLSGVRTLARVERQGFELWSFFFHRYIYDCDGTSERARIIFELSELKLARFVPHKFFLSCLLRLSTSPYRFFSPLTYGCV